MKLYVWDNVDFGAYHADGGAAILADSEQEALGLLLERVHNWDIERDGLKHQQPATRVIDLAEADKSRVVLYYYGCDC